MAIAPVIGGLSLLIIPLALFLQKDKPGDVGQFQVGREPHGTREHPACAASFATRA